MSTIHFVRTDSANPDFIDLVRELDEELARRDGPDNMFYSQFNKIDHIKYAVVGYSGITATAIGAIKEFGEDAVEVKRMFTLPQYRGRSIAKQLLASLEEWALELGFKKCVLETGKRQPEAISLYLKSGYSQIENYGQYRGVENSVCFEKALHKKD